MSGPKNGVLIVGGPPRVDLLPPEVAAGKKARAVRRQLGLVVVGVFLICGAGFAAASLQAIGSLLRLESERAVTSDLLAQQAELVEVRTLASEVDSVTAARDLGASTEINWLDYMTQLQATLPAGVVLVSYTVDSGTPVLLYPAPTAALEGQRIGTLAFIATTTNLPDVQAWLIALQELPGYVDAKVGSINRADDGTYTFDIVLHIGQEAYSDRFAEVDESVTSTESTSVETSDGE